MVRASTLLEATYAEMTGVECMLHWIDEYKIGNDRIDFEHHIFFNLVIDFQNARVTGAPKEKLERILDEIALYARFHFRSEENMMVEMQCPGLEEHRKQHYDLVEVLSNKMLALSMGQQTPIQVEEFLIHWFVHHVTHEDTKLTEYFKGYQSSVLNGLNVAE